MLTTPFERLILTPLWVPVESPVNPNPPAPTSSQPTATGLYTTVQCLTASPRFYGFLGTHGRRLEPGEQYTTPGDLATTLASRDSLRSFRALERSLMGFIDDEGNPVEPSLLMIKSPSVFLIDETTDAIKTIALNNGSLTVSDTFEGAVSSLTV